MEINHYASPRAQRQTRRSHFTVMLAMLLRVLHAHMTVEMGAVCAQPQINPQSATETPPSRTAMTRRLGTVASSTAWKALLLRCSWHRRAHVPIGLFPDRRVRASHPGETVSFTVFSGLCLNFRVGRFMTNWLWKFCDSQAGVQGISSPAKRRLV